MRLERLSHLLQEQKLNIAVVGVRNELIWISFPVEGPKSTFERVNKTMRRPLLVVNTLGIYPEVPVFRKEFETRIC